MDFRGIVDENCGKVRTGNEVIHEPKSGTKYKTINMQVKNESKATETEEATKNNALRTPFHILHFSVV